MVRSRQNISLPRPAAARARTADMYGLHRNLLSDSFLFNNQFRDSVGESEERTLLTHMNGRVNLDQGAAEEGGGGAVQCHFASHRRGHNGFWVWHGLWPRVGLDATALSRGHEHGSIYVGSLYGHGMNERLETKMAEFAHA